MAQPYQHRVRPTVDVAIPHPVRTVRLGAAESAPDTSMIAETAVDAPIAVGYMLGGIVGSALAGSFIGYLTTRTGRGATTGAVAGSGVWAATGSFSEFRGGHAMLGAGLGVISIGALAYAWMRKR